MEKVRGSEGCNMRTGPTIAGLQGGGRWPQSEECRQSLQVGKGKYMFSPIASKKDCSPANTLTSAQ